MKKRNLINLTLNTEIHFLWKGYFTAPDSNWIHMSREIDSYEVFYVTKGTLYISDGQTDYTVQKNEYLITAPCKNQHGWKASICEFYYFHFYLDHQKEGAVSASSDGSHTTFCELPQQGIYTDLSTLENYYSLLSYHPERQMVCNHILTAILLDLKNGDSEMLPNNIIDVCHAIQTYIDLAPTDQLCISSLAEKFQYNKKYLSQCFKQQTGIPLKKYLKDETIKRAKHMLSYTTLSINEIAEQSGYSDVHSFSHIFKNTVGQSPRQYREQSQ